MVPKFRTFATVELRKTIHHPHTSTYIDHHYLNIVQQIINLIPLIQYETNIEWHLCLVSWSRLSFIKWIFFLQLHLVYRVLGILNNTYSTSSLAHSVSKHNLIHHAVFQQKENTSFCINHKSLVRLWRENYSSL